MWWRIASYNFWQRLQKPLKIVLDKRKYWWWNSYLHFLFLFKFKWMLHSLNPQVSFLYIRRVFLQDKFHNEKAQHCSFLKNNVIKIMNKSIFVHTCRENLSISWKLCLRLRNPREKWGRNLKNGMKVAAPTTVKSRKPSSMWAINRRKRGSSLRNRTLIKSEQITLDTAGIR